LSGLAAAYRIERGAAARGLEVEAAVLERGERPGGKIRTHAEAGYVCESGPNGFLDGKPWALELALELGLEPRMIRADATAKKRLVYWGRKLHVLPASPADFLKFNLLSIPGRARVLAEPLIKPFSGEESVRKFAERRLGIEFARRIIDPMVSGVFAGSPDALSVASAFPRIKELELKYGGLIRAFVAISRERAKERHAGKSTTSAAGPAGPGGTVTSFESGAEQFTDALASAISGQIVYNTAVDRIVSDADGGWRIFVNGTDEVETDACVVAAPAYAAADMLAGFDGEITAAMRAISYASCVVIAIGMRLEDMGKEPDSFGFLIPANERRNILGCLFDSVIFTGRAPEGRVLLRVFAGGFRNPSFVELSDSEILDRALDDLKKILRLRGAPEFVKIFRHERAIPQYTLGHGRRAASIEERAKKHPGLFIAGNAYRGIAINDCCRESATVADAVINYLAK
jgi:oxygen-dependent protoporphyrinogen oxidase